MRRTVEVSLISFAIGIFLPFATSESLFLSDEMIANTNFDDSISSRSAVADMITCGNNDVRASCSQCWDEIVDTCTGEDCGIFRNENFGTEGITCVKKGKCATWPSSKRTCAGGDGVWVTLDRTTTSANECEKLCLDRKWNSSAMNLNNGLKNGNGCCFVGEQYGCWWVDGAIPTNVEGANSYTGDYKAVTCTILGTCEAEHATDSKQCSEFRKYDYVVIMNRPCKVVEISTKTGKDGQSEVQISGLDIFTGIKFEDNCPSDDSRDIPYVKSKDYKLIDIFPDGVLELYDSETGDTRDDFRVFSDLADRIRQTSDNGIPTLCTVLSACGEEAVIARKLDL